MVSTAISFGTSLVPYRLIVNKDGKQIEWVTFDTESSARSIDTVIWCLRVLNRSFPVPSSDEDTNEDKDIVMSRREPDWNNPTADPRITDEDLYGTPEVIEVESGTQLTPFHGPGHPVDEAGSIDLDSDDCMSVIGSDCTDETGNSGTVESSNIDMNTGGGESDKMSAWERFRPAAREGKGWWMSEEYLVLFLTPLVGQKDVFLRFGAGKIIVPGWFTGVDSMRLKIQ